MSTVMPEKVKCFMCGTESEFRVLASTNTFGPTDLDTRPPEMKRSTMCYWLQSCPVCGYVAAEVSDECSIDKAFLDSKAYKECKGIPFTSDLAKKFYRHYLIMMAEEEKEAAFSALLHASWACDDAGDDENASIVRKKAIELADGLLQQKDYDGKDTLSLIRADMMRRAALFDELLEKYESAKYKEDLLNKIINFEKELARRKYAKCLTVKDAIDFADGSFNWATLVE